MRRTSVLIFMLVLSSLLLFGCNKTEVNPLESNPGDDSTELVEPLTDNQLETPPEILMPTQVRESIVVPLEEVPAETASETTAAAEEVTSTETTETAPETTETAETTENISTGPQTHLVQFTKSGLTPTRLTIKAGDTVIWENARTTIKGLLLGTQSCSEVRSAILNPGETFQWTFTEPLRCPFVDGIYVTAMMIVIVE